MQRVIITGANSFIGRCLATKMQSEGMEVVTVIRPGRSHSKFLNGTTVLELNMEQYDQLGRLAGSCDCFVHLAWSGTRGPARIDAAQQKENLENSLAGVHSMLEAGCRRIVIAGSQAEYGPHADKITEKSKCCPNTEYGKAKLDFYRQTAQLCMEFGAEYREPRFFSLYGPGDSAGTMIISILQDMLANRPCKLTQCVQYWDFLYLADAIDALYRLCTAVCPSGVYNFGSGDVRPLKAYVLEMARITGTCSELCFGAIPYPFTGMVSLWPDVSKLKRELDWQPQTIFSRGIKNILSTL